MHTAVAGWDLTHTPLRGAASCTVHIPANIPTRPGPPSAMFLQGMVGTALSRILSSPFLLHPDTANKTHELSLHAGDALPEQDGEGGGREKQCRASLEEPTTKSSPKSTKVPEQSPRSTHLHIGVARTALCSHQSFCFHDWKGNGMITSQSSRAGIPLPHTPGLPRLTPHTGTGVGGTLTHPCCKCSLG